MFFSRHYWIAYTPLKATQAVFVKDITKKGEKKQALILPGIGAQQ
jgi:hypothetical protein